MLSKIVEMNVASGNNLTVPLDSSQAFPVGTTITVLQTGTESNHYCCNRRRDSKWNAWFKITRSMVICNANQACNRYLGSDWRFERMSLIIGAGQGGMQPSTPIIGTATGGDSSASVAFTPSTYIGKSSIVYRAISNPGGFSATNTTTPITVTGLSNGTAYTFTVRGETPYGVNSLSSAASNSVTPAPFE
jgi:hypothetical protein